MTLILRSIFCLLFIILYSNNAISHNRIDTEVFNSTSNDPIVNKFTYKNESNDSLIALSLKMKALDCYKNFYFEEAVFYNKKSLDIYKKLNDSIGISACYCNMAAAYKEMNRLEEAEKLYYKALLIDKNLNDKSGMAILYNNIGELFHIKASYLKALYFYLNSLSLEKELNNKKGIADCYLNMGALFEENNMYDYALQYYNNALEYYNATTDFYRTAQCYNNLGVLYTKTKSFYLAKDYLKKSIKIKYENKMIEPMLTSFINIGCLNIIMNDTIGAIDCFKKALKISKGNIYSDTVDYPSDYTNSSTDDYFFSWVSDNLDAENYGLIAENLHYKAIIHYNLGDYQKAIENFINSLELCGDSSMSHLEVNNYFYLYKSFYHLKDYKNALFYADKYIIISDSNYKSLIKDFVNIVREDDYPLVFNKREPSETHTTTDEQKFYKNIWFYSTIVLLLLLSLKLFVSRKP